MIRRRNFLGGILGIGVAPLEALANLITAEDVYSLPEPITAEDVYRPPAPESKASAAPPQRVQVLVYTIPKCEPCARMKRDVAKLETIQGPVFEFVFIEGRGRHPAWVSDYLTKGYEYPFLDYTSKGGEWLFHSGWKDFETFYGKWEQGKTKAATVAKVDRPLTSGGEWGRTGGYPIRGDWWNHNGHDASWEHLTQGLHAGKFDSAWLARLSHAEIQSLHSDDHEGRVRWAYAFRPGQYSSGSVVSEVPRRTSRRRG